MNLKILNVLILILFAICYLLFAIVPVKAQTMTNDSFKIQMGNLNSIAGESAGEGFNINITSGELSPGLYEGENFRLRAGFQYVPRSSPFSFSISNSRIDFGSLSPTNPVTRTTTLTVQNSSAPSYQVTASQNHQLLTKAGAIIPDTTCDRGTCSEKQAAEWSSILTYGFGYRCDSLSIVPDKGAGGSCKASDTSFSQNPSFFKQFADVSRTEKSEVIVTGSKGSSQKASVTYKVNISSSQATGVYSNTITYVATPGF